MSLSAAAALLIWLSPAARGAEPAPGVLKNGKVDAAILDCYQRHGGAAKLGVPSDDGKGSYAYKGPRAVSQDFSDGGPGAGSACMRCAGAKKAFLLSPAIKPTYVSGGGVDSFLGCPVADLEGVAPDIYQRFQGGVIAFDETLGLMRPHTKAWKPKAAPAVDFTPDPRRTDSPTSRRRSSF